jgi:phospholipid/cholesterol/gamma-HCH transport system substrate-binding protein
MRVDRRIKIQLAVFTVIALIAVPIMLFGYVKLPEMVGIGRYTVTVELPAAGGLYKRGNVTYRGTEVGRIQDVRLTSTGVEAVLSLNSDTKIPSDLDAEVHSQSAVGEQYIALVPRNGTSPPLKNGDVIPLNRTSVPPDINSLLDATNRGLLAIPQDNLKTAIDESYTAIGGLGPEISRIVKGSTQLAIDARKNLDPLEALIEQSQPVLDSQTDTSDDIQAWAAHLAKITTGLKVRNDSLGAFLQQAPAVEQARAAFERLQPTLPILLANLVSVGKVAVVYQDNIEQILVLIPQGIANLQAMAVANANTKQGYLGLYLDFHLNLNVPPACTTGFLPAQQVRDPNHVDAPDRPKGDLYCRVPQDSPFGVRGARNYPCETVPGKRAPTVKMCESNEQYVPLNDGLNWKGDPNATVTGQDIPQLPPGSPPAQAPPGPPPARAPPGPPPAQPPPPDPPPPAIGAAEYDPATGTYIGPDGQMHTQSELAQTAPKERTWQTMLMPPASN